MTKGPKFCLGVHKTVVSIVAEKQEGAYKNNFQSHLPTKRAAATVNLDRKKILVCMANDFILNIRHGPNTACTICSLWNQSA